MLRNVTPFRACLTLLCIVLVCGAWRCSFGKSEQLNSDAKASAYGIQHAVDGFKDTLATLQATNKINPDDAIVLARDFKEVNRVNDELIDVAWDSTTHPDSSQGERADRLVTELEEKINAALNSGAFVKNKESQQLFQTLAKTLLDDLKVIKKAR